MRSARRCGFLAACPQLPTASTVIPPTATLADDTAVIRQAITKLADAGHPIILLMHSYEDLVGTNAVEDLLWLQQQSKGNPRRGGIVHLYVAALMSPVGSCVLDPFGGQMPPWLDNNVTNGP